MKPVRMDDLWRILPPLDELQPALDVQLIRSLPDPDQVWAGSGELGTAGDRIVDPGVLRARAEAIADEVHRHLQATYGLVADGVAAVASGDRNAAAERFLEIAALEEARDRHDRAEAWASSAEEVSQDEHDHRVHARAIRRRARACRAQGKLEEALHRYDSGKLLAERIGDIQGFAEASLGAGNVLEEQGRWPEAERRYRDALRALDEGELDRVPERWHALLNLSIVARNQGELAESRMLLESAGEAAGDDPAAMVFLENALGQLHQEEGDLAAAEAHLRNAMEAAGSAFARTVIGANLAQVLLAQQRLLDAAEAARAAELEALSGAAVTRLPEVYRILGRIAAESGNPDAFVLFERALEIVRDRGLPRIEAARTLEAYAQVEARYGDKGTAADLLEQAKAIFEDLGVNVTNLSDFGAEYDPSGPVGPDSKESNGVNDE